jgi:predicted anti-sigma-YlaC factor YlaD
VTISKRSVSALLVLVIAVVALIPLAGSAGPTLGLAQSLAVPSASSNTSPWPAASAAWKSLPRAEGMAMVKRYTCHVAMAVRRMWDWRPRRAPS